MLIYFTVIFILFFVGLTMYKPKPIQIVSEVSVIPTKDVETFSAKQNKPLITKMDGLKVKESIEDILKIFNANQPPYAMADIVNTATYYKGTMTVRQRDWAISQIGMILNGLYRSTGRPWKFTTLESITTQVDSLGKTRVSIEFWADNPDEYAARRFMLQLGYEENIWRIVALIPLYSDRTKIDINTQMGTYGLDNNFVESEVNQVVYNKPINLMGPESGTMEYGLVENDMGFLVQPTKQREMESIYRTPGGGPSIRQEPCREEKFAWDVYGVQKTEPKGRCFITNTSSGNWMKQVYDNPTIGVLPRTNDGLHGMFELSNNMDGSNITTY